jgi:hypothetical protein
MPENKGCNYPIQLARLARPILCLTVPDIFLHVLTSSSPGHQTWLIFHASDDIYLHNLWNWSDHLSKSTQFRFIWSLLLRWVRYLCFCSPVVVFGCSAALFCLWVIENNWNEMPGHRYSVYLFCVFSRLLCSVEVSICIESSNTPDL